MYGTSSSSSRKRTYPHVSLIIVIQYSPLQSGYAPRWDTWRRSPLHHRLLLTLCGGQEHKQNRKPDSGGRRDATPATGLTATGGDGERTPFSASSLSLSLSISFSLYFFLSLYLSLFRTPSRPPAALHTTPKTRLDHHDNNDDDDDDDDELLGAPLRDEIIYVCGRRRRRRRGRRG